MSTLIDLTVFPSGLAFLKATTFSLICANTCSLVFFITAMGAQETLFHLIGEAIAESTFQLGFKVW